MVRRARHRLAAELEVWQKSVGPRNVASVRKPRRISRRHRPICPARLTQPVLAGGSTLTQRQPCSDQTERRDRRARTSRSGSSPWAAHIIAFIRCRQTDLSRDSPGPWCTRVGACDLPVRKRRLYERESWPRWTMRLGVGPRGRLSEGDAQIVGLGHESIGVTPLDLRCGRPETPAR